MKYAIVSDTQFDEGLRYSTILPNGLPSRLVDQVECMKWVGETAVKKGCRRMIHCGDFYDSRTSIGLAVLDQIHRVFTELRPRFEKIYVFPGNHDSLLRNPSIHSLHTMSGICDVIESPLLDGRLGFLPWTEDITTYAESVDKLLDAGAKVLFSHLTVVGSIPGGGGVPTDILQPSRWRRIFLGDIHEPLSLPDNIQYVGSVMQHHFGDAGGTRGFIVYDDTTDKWEFVENDVSPRFYVVKDKAPRSVRPQDFVRIESENLEVSKRLTDQLRGVSKHVETTLVELSTAEPRLDIHVADSHADVLRRYVAHQKAEPAEDLVKLGLELIAEAKRSS